MTVLGLAARIWAHTTVEIVRGFRTKRLITEQPLTSAVLWYNTALFVTRWDELLIFRAAFPVPFVLRDL
jgi:hypothetical protein